MRDEPISAEDQCKVVTQDRKLRSWNSENEWQFSIFGLILFAAFMAFAIYRDRVRRKSLRKRDDGMYVWIEWHGGERTSDHDPSEAGGDWDSDGDGDSDGGDGD